MVLSDRTIREEIAKGRLGIEPLEPGHIQPASVDVRLDSRILTFRRPAEGFIDIRAVNSDLTEPIDLKPDQPFVLNPNDFILVRTLESLTLPDDIVAKVEGKSSLGRIGLMVHITSGYVDPGWSGKLTLQLKNAGVMPIGIYAGMKIAQLSFLRTTSPVDAPYGSSRLGSHYQGGHKQL